VLPLIGQRAWPDADAERGYTGAQAPSETPVGCLGSAKTVMP